MTFFPPFPFSIPRPPREATHADFKTFFPPPPKEKPGPKCSRCGVELRHVCEYLGERREVVGKRWKCPECSRYYTTGKKPGSPSKASAPAVSPKSERSTAKTCVFCKAGVEELFNVSVGESFKGACRPCFFRLSPSPAKPPEKAEEPVALPLRCLKCGKLSAKFVQAEDAERELRRCESCGAEYPIFNAIIRDLMAKGLSLSAARKKLASETKANLERLFS